MNSTAIEEVLFCWNSNRKEVIGEKDRMRNERFIGAFILGVYLVIYRFFNVPALFLGLLLGISLYFIVIGMLPENSYVKVKKWKSSFRNMIENHRYKRL